MYEKEIQDMIDITKYAEKIGLKIKDKLYPEEWDGKYIGMVFRCF